MIQFSHFVIGTCSVIKAWDVALRTMKVGEVVVIYLQDRSVSLWKHWVPTGYPEETLTFEVEVVAVDHIKVLVSAAFQMKGSLCLLARKTWFDSLLEATDWNLDLFPNLDKVVFLDNDIVIQRDLSPLWDINLSGKVNGAVKTCKGEDEWVMSKRFRNYFNFSHPIIAKNLNPENCAWAYGMNIFDLPAWRKKNITNTYHSWLKEEDCV
ncbi:hypothetical protein H5410_001466 [Solanum commersonii]|uniref:Hexosyltransferase n=1 Tax=Solanum commersonii TaxID=4109 RepID=A0A9J6AYU6_SOLCO|nr:hypothetical protein H5410_001466 [Solanum commersonii]